MLVSQTVLDHAGKISELLREYCDKEKIPVDVLILILRYLNVQYELTIADYLTEAQRVNQELRGE